MVSIRLRNDNNDNNHVNDHNDNNNIDNNDNDNNNNDNNDNDNNNDDNNDNNNHDNNEYDNNDNDSNKDDNEQQIYTDNHDSTVDGYIWATTATTTTTTTTTRTTTTTTTNKQTNEQQPTNQQQQATSIKEQFHVKTLTATCVKVSEASRLTSCAPWVLAEIEESDFQRLVEQSRGQTEEDEGKQNQEKFQDLVMFVWLFIIVFVTIV